MWGVPCGQFGARRHETEFLLSGEGALALLFVAVLEASAVAIEVGLGGVMRGVGGRRRLTSVLSR